VNTKEKMNVCRKLALSFRRHELTDDLIQEGMIAMLEAEARGNTHPETLRTNARKRMQDFISLRQGPLSIAPSDKTRENAKAIRSGSEAPVLNMGEDTYDSLKVALGTSTALLEGDEVMYEGNTEEYIWVQQVEDLMREKLSEKDFQIFQMRFGPEEFTQVEVAKALDMSERNVRLREHSIQKKLSRLK